MNNAAAATASKISSIGQTVAKVDVQIGPKFLNLFSEHLYSSPNKAFEELISNSWDAGASAVYIFVPENLHADTAAVWVLDNGCSMDIAGFTDLWSVATSNKRTAGPKQGRKQIGKFGVGKLATYLLADELTYICKASDGKIRIVTMDYRRIDNAQDSLHIDKLPLTVRELSLEELKSAITPFEQGKRALELIEAKIPNPKKSAEYVDEYGGDQGNLIPPQGTWTLAVLTSLKEEGKRLQKGQMQRILKAALPLGNSINIQFNDTVLYSTKSNVVVQKEWKIGPKLGIEKIDLPGGKSFSVIEKDSPYDHIEIVGFGAISGQVRLYKEKISGGKSEEVDFSNGFFVNVFGRVLKPEDQYFGLSNLSHSSWSKFRATVRSDALDPLLSVNREGLADNEKLLIFRTFLMKLFNIARNAHDAAVEAQWPDASNVLISKWGLLPFEPLKRAISDRMQGQSFSFIDTSKIEDVSKAHKEWNDETNKNPEKFIKDVVVEDSTADDDLVKYNVATRRVIVNKSHPFAQEHGTTQEQIRLLRDAALVELLTNAYMVEIGIPDDQIKEILRYRDRAYRLVAHAQRHSGIHIANLLSNSTNHAKGFERIVGDALEHLGFEVERLGQSGQPEGVATAITTPILNDGTDQKTTYRFTYDAKSSATGKASTHNVGVSGLGRHKKDHEAKYSLVVAPDFAKGALEKEAKDAGVTPIRAADLAKLVMITAGLGPISLSVFESIFKHHGPDAVSTWVSDLGAMMEKQPHLSLEVLINALTEITASNLNIPDMLNCSLVADRARTILKNHNFPNKDQVWQIIMGLSHIIPNVVSISSNKYDFMLSAPPAKIKAAIAAQLDNVPSNIKFGLIKEVE